MLIFSLEVHECFSFWNIKKIAKIYFDLKAFVCKKPNDLLKQHMNNKSSDKKEFYSLLICNIQEKNPFSFFFLKLFF